MAIKVTLAEVLTPELIDQHYQHILDFLHMEGIMPATPSLGATVLSDRQIKELLEELAEDR